MPESLRNQMENLSLEPDRIIGKSLDTELEFYTSVKNCLLNTELDQSILFRFMLGKFSINLFFLSEIRLGESNANKICAMTEDCFEQKNESMHCLGWCSDFKMDQERVCLGNLKYRVMFTYINIFKACWAGSTEEEKSCVYVLCVNFLVNFYDLSKS